MKINREMSYRSIAVIGFERSGKKTICSALGESPKKSTDWRKPDRYKMKTEFGIKYPEFERYVLSVYTKKGQLNLDMPESIGILVLRPSDIERLLCEDATEWYYYFFKLLENLIALGVERYLICITFFDKWKEAHQQPKKMFEEYSEKIINFFRKRYSISVEGCVPVAKFGNCLLGIDNESGDHILSWYEDKPLLAALQTLIRSQKSVSDKLLALGKFGNFGTGHGVIEATFSPDKIARGQLEDGLPVQIGTDRVMATLKEKIDSQNYKIVFSPDSEIPDEINEHVVFPQSQLLRPNQYILAEVLVDRAAKKYAIDSWKDCLITFFGAQRAEPAKIKNENNWPFQKSVKYNYLSSTDKSKEKSLGNKQFLKIDIREYPVVYDLFPIDPDFGRIIIWKFDQPKHPKLIATGRIIDASDCAKNDDNIKKIWECQLEQIKHHKKSVRPHSKLHKCFHKIKSLFWNICNNIDSFPDSIKRLNNLDFSFTDMLREINKTMGSISEGPLEYIRREKQDLKYYLEKITAENLTEKNIIAMASRLASEYEKKCERLNKYDCEIKDRVASILQQLSIESVDIEKLLTEKPSLNNPIPICNRLPEHWQFYPVKSDLFESIQSAFDELDLNSQKYSPTKQKRFIIFIDPPVPEHCDCVKITFLEFTILDKQIKTRINDSVKGGIKKIIINDLKDSGIECEYPGRLGDCIGLAVYLPVIISRHDHPTEITLEFIELCSQENCFIKGNAFSYLEKLETVFNKQKIEIGENLEQLFDEIENDLKENYQNKRKEWIQGLNESIKRFQKDSHISGSDLQDAMDIIGKTLHRPAFNIIKEAQQYVKERCNISISNDNSNSIAPHCLKFPNQYRSIRHTVDICIILISKAIQNENNKIILSVIKSPEKKKDELIITIEIEVEGLEKILMPIPTRLRALGADGEIASDNLKQFNIILPIIPYI